MRWLALALVLAALLLMDCAPKGKQYQPLYPGAWRVDE